MVEKIFFNNHGTIFISMLDLQATSGSWFKAAKRYLNIGLEHILLGTDHLLFVLGLLLIASNYVELIKIITGFTVGHSITLGLATLGYLHVPSRPVEAAIALSIMFLAVEIIQMRTGKPSLISRYPWYVTFLFGLLHGLGFAGALSEIGLPANEIPFVLLFFNCGIELGQLFFITVTVLFLKLCQRIFLLPQNIFLVPPYAMGIIAAYWFIERTIIYCKIL